MTDEQSTIDSLDVSEGLEAKLRFVRNNLKRRVLGIPDYGLKGTAIFKMISFWDF